MDAGEQQTTQQAQQSQLCAGNCGFFANNNLSGFCSKCHRERMQATTTQPQPKSEALPTPGPSRPAASLESSPAAVPAPSTAPEASTADPAAAASPSKASTRCLTCRKKVGLTGFSCRCGGLFCGQHRYAEAHCCTFDYKSLQRQKLAENNPVVQASKVHKI